MLDENKITSNVLAEEEAQRKRYTEALPIKEKERLIKSKVKIFKEFCMPKDMIAKAVEEMNTRTKGWEIDIVSERHLHKYLQSF